MSAEAAGPTVSGVISEQEFLAAHRLHRRRTVNRQLLLHGSLVVVGLVVAFTMHVVAGLVLAGAGVGGLAGEWALSRFFLPRRHKKTYRQQVTLHQKVTCSWDGDGLRANAESGHAMRRWSDYVRALEDKQVFILYQSDVLFEIFPKSWFVEEEHIDSFRRFSRASA